MRNTSTFTLLVNNSKQLSEQIINGQISPEIWCRNVQTPTELLMLSSKLHYVNEDTYSGHFEALVFVSIRVFV